MVVTDSPQALLEDDAPVSADLARLAEAYRVAHEFWDWRGNHVPVSTRTVVRVLAALDVTVRTEADVAAELERVRLAPWRRLLPDVVVRVEGSKDDIQLHLPEGDAGRLSVWLELETGARVELSAGAAEAHEQVEGARVVRLPCSVPDPGPARRARARRPGG